MKSVNILFDGPPHEEESGQYNAGFLGVRNSADLPIKIGEWIMRDDGNYALRISESDFAQPLLDESDPPEGGSGVPVKGAPSRDEIALDLLKIIITEIHEPAMNMKANMCAGLTNLPTK